MATRCGQSHEIFSWEFSNSFSSLTLCAHVAALNTLDFHVFPLAAFWLAVFLQLVPHTALLFFGETMRTVLVERQIWAAWNCSNGFSVFGCGCSGVSISLNFRLSLVALFASFFLKFSLSSEVAHNTCVNVKSRLENTDTANWRRRKQWHLLFILKISKISKNSKISKFQNFSTLLNFKQF